MLGSCLRRTVRRLDSVTFSDVHISLQFTVWNLGSRASQSNRAALAGRVDPMPGTGRRTAGPLLLLPGAAVIGRVCSRSAAAARWEFVDLSGAFSSSASAGTASRRRARMPYLILAARDGRLCAPRPSKHAMRPGQWPETGLAGHLPAIGRHPRQQGRERTT